MMFRFSFCVFLILSLLYVIPWIVRPLFEHFLYSIWLLFSLYFILNSHCKLHKFRIKYLRYSRGREGAPYFLSNGNWRAEKSGKSQRLKDSKQLMTAALDILPDDIGQGFSMIASVLCLLKKKNWSEYLNYTSFQPLIYMHKIDPLRYPLSTNCTGWVTK